MRETLESAGIPARIVGQLRPSIAGEIPIPDAMVEVWVDDEDEATAKALLAGLDEQAKAAEWTCEACAEANPATFEVCWKCGGVRGPR